ncbi:MAG: PilW family protein [Pseudomonadota bacterium]
MILRTTSSSSRQLGFSLVELMIAMVLGLLVIVGATGVFLSNKESYRTGTALSRVQEGSRIAFELISRDIRSASLTGCGNTGRVGNAVKNAATYWWANWDNGVVGYSGSGADNNPALTTGTATSQHITGTDSVVLIGADDITYSASAGADGSATAPFRTVESADLSLGDIIIACTAGGGAAIQQATIAQITSVPAAGSYVTGLTGATPGNCTTGLGYPTNCTTANNFTFPYASTLISKLKSVSWYLGVNPQGTRSLYRMVLLNNVGTATAQAQEMVRDITNFQLAYHISGADGFVDAATVTAAGAGSWGTVDAVQITVDIQAADTRAGVNATPITRQTVATVALRNRIN